MAAGTPHKDGVRGRRCSPPPARKKSRGPQSGDLVFLGPGPRRPPGAPCRAQGREAATRSCPGWVGWGLAYSSRSPRPGTRRATAPLLGNCPPSGAPPRPLWKEGSRPRGPPQRSQSAGRIGTEAGRQRLPLGAAPVKHRRRRSHLRAQRAVGGHIPPSSAWWLPDARALRGRVVRHGLGPAYLADCSHRVSRRSRPQFPLKRPGELASAVTSGAAAARASPRRKKSARQEGLASRRGEERPLARYLRSRRCIERLSVLIYLI